MRPAAVPIRAVIVALALALSIIAAPAAAQMGTPTTVADSLVSHSFLPKVLQTLAYQFARAARDTALRTVWDIQLPEENRAAWIPLRDFVLRVTNGRLATAADSGVYTLAIRSFVPRGDSLELNFNVGSRWRCANGGGGGSGTMYAIRMSPPDPRFGGYRRVYDPVQTGNYDSIGCGVGGRGDGAAATNRFGPRRNGDGSLDRTLNSILKQAGLRS
jgi:hypothetical protein